MPRKISHEQRINTFSHSMNLQTITSGETRSLVSTKPFQNPSNVRPRSGVRSATKLADGRKEVFFELVASSAKEVLLAGDFTGWEKTPIKLRRGERGAWRASVMLAPGQYHYKFVVDGQWRDDPRAPTSCPNPFGTCDSVVEIS
jgi:1,4-alpha-glucan branching enzyme